MVIIILIASAGGFCFWLFIAFFIRKKWSKRKRKSKEEKEEEVEMAAERQLGRISEATVSSEHSPNSSITERVPINSVEEKVGSDENERKLELEAVEEEKESGPRYFIVDPNEEKWEGESTLHVPSLPPSTLSIGREHTPSFREVEDGEEEATLSSNASETKTSTENTGGSSELGANLYLQ